MPPSNAGPPAVGPDDRPVLAAALRHLLERDGDRPARWATPGFAADVDEHRARLAATPDGDGAPPVSTGLTFEGAVARLASDPAAVALAVRRLEAAGRRRLPSWNDLVRGRLPATPSHLEVELWFG